MRARVIARAAVVLVALAAVAGPAFAQIQQLPATSRSEAQSQSLNNSLVNQGQSRGAAQQNQFEVNSLRNDSARTASPPAVAAPPVAGPAGVRR
jgi:hypothetical protein